MFTFRTFGPTAYLKANFCTTSVPTCTVRDSTTLWWKIRPFQLLLHLWSHEGGIIAAVHPKVEFFRYSVTDLPALRTIPFYMGIPHIGTGIDSTTRTVCWPTAIVAGLQPSCWPT